MFALRLVEERAGFPLSNKCTTNVRSFLLHLLAGWLADGDTGEWMTTWSGARQQVFHPNNT
jgi:hypothetical protein